MTKQSTAERTTLVAHERERRQAQELLLELDGHVDGMTLEVLNRTAPVPRELASIMGRVLEIVADGGTAVVGSLPEELTTTVAAEQLGISRPTLMKLVREGALPARKVGTHHRVKTSDVQEFRRERLRQQRAAFDELRALEDRLDSD